MISHVAAQLVRKHEGLRLKPYRCSAGKLTIGYGRNLDDRGITIEEADDMLNNDLAQIEQDLFERIDFFHRLDPIRQAVLIDMAYNLGVKGLWTFRKTMNHLELGEWEDAAREMLDSKWAKQVKGRAKELAEIIRTGKTE
jgi:lysozyme